MTPLHKDAVFDVIIAGGGPAGCVLANRLSEDTSQQILLVEAGSDVIPGEEHPDVLDPFPTSDGNPTFLWPNLVAETGAKSQNGASRKKEPYIQGYGIGGGSNINGMGADRGNPEDYDEWRDLGAEGWGWSDVLPYFRKLERDLDFSSAPLSSMHGGSGPMPVRRLPRAHWAPFASAIGVALERRGFSFLEDYNADFREGFSAAPKNCSPEQRISTSMAYLTQEVRRRKNLTIVADSRVDRVSITHRRADGVFVSRKGRTSLVRGRQVILSCGALQTPAVLMRSGIGPGHHLVSHGIEVITDLPGVGANLQNHPCILLAMYLARDAHQSGTNREFLQNWARFSSNEPNCAPNDMHLIPFNRCAWHNLGRSIGAIAIAVFKSYSKGYVNLSGADPAKAPNIHFNLLADTRDFDRLVGGFRFVLELLTDPAVARTRDQIFFPNSRMVASMSRRNWANHLMANAGAWALDREILRRIFLSRNALDPRELLGNEDTLRDLVRAYAQPEYHVCGTCRIGNARDPSAVVDSEAQVIGIEALRIVDASTFPTLPRANTHFTVLMVAEKLADAIKSTWRVHRSSLATYASVP